MALDSTIPSKLSLETQELFKLIFDISAMKEVISELFNLDMNDMDMGTAYKALTDLSESILQQKGGCRGNNSMSASDSDLQLDKWESLSGVKTAYSMLNELKAGRSGGSPNPIDNLYGQLEIKLTVLDKKSDDFKNIEKYMQDSRYCNDNYDNYNIKIQEIFHVERSDEDNRYRYKSSSIKKSLLFHGTRITNMAGILSRGLQIAPPEVPHNGYILGKGIYFADMTSKSIQYCNISYKNKIGILLICEVALGKVEEYVMKPDDVTKLPSSRKFKSVKGVGTIYPHSDGTYTTNHGVSIPKNITIYRDRDDDKQTSFDFNQFVVYNKDQIIIRYLVQLKFE